MYIKELHSEKKKIFIYLLLLAVSCVIGFQGWRTLLNNFAVEYAGFSGADMGIVQSVREIPGILSLLVVYVLLFISEKRLAALSVAVMGSGIMLAGQFPSLWGLTITTLIMSFGFHYYATLGSSLTLQAFSSTESPLILGRLKSAESLTNIATGAVVFIFSGLLDYSNLFLAAGIIPLSVGLWFYAKPPALEGLSTQKKEIKLHKRYWLYYGLTLFSGARRQIFVAFAVFLLVKKFDYTIQAVTALFIFNNLINAWINPKIGRAINHFGERKILSLEYAGLILVFIAYALVDNYYLAGFLYIMDNILYNCAMGIKTFFQKIAKKEDIASGMAVGFTINHLIAVLIPVTGGLVWLLDYRYVFFGAAALASVSLILAQFVTMQVDKKE